MAAVGARNSAPAQDVTGRVLVLIAGYPGTGKSRLSALLQERLGPFTALALDDAKEGLYDQEGFVDAAAKAHVDRAALELFLARVRRALAEGAPVLAEYPFSEKQRPALEKAARDFGYRVVTVRMVADFEVLFDRQRRRDLDPARHPGHLVDAYRPGDSLGDRRDAPQLLTLEVFLDRYLHRGYGEFALGTVIEVDTTEFDHVDDDALITRIAHALTQNRTGTRS